MDRAHPVRPRTLPADSPPWRWRAHEGQASSDRTPLHPTTRAPAPAVSPPTAVAHQTPVFLFAMWRGSAAGQLGAGGSLAGVARPGKAWPVLLPWGSPRDQYSIQMFSMQERADTRSAW